MRAAYGDEILANQPLEYTVQSEVVFNEKGVLSIKQIVHLFMGGPSGTSYFGSTFDLRTGDMIPFTRFADVVADDYRANLTKFILDDHHDFPINTDEQKKVSCILKPNTTHDFKYIESSYGSNEYEGDLSYDYYYDGKSINLIFNQITSYSFVLKWNGEIGNEFQAVVEPQFLKPRTLPQSSS